MNLNISKKTATHIKLLVLTYIFSSSGLAHSLGIYSPKMTPVTAPILSLFDAMREHDEDKLMNQFTSQALLQRITSEGEIKQNSLEKFANSIGQHKAYLDEHLLDIIVHQQNELASVWTPFAFYLDGKLSHCGSNSFQLVKIKNEWKIQYLIDVTYDGDCQKFIEQHTK